MRGFVTIWIRGNKLNWYGSSNLSVFQINYDASHDYVESVK